MNFSVPSVLQVWAVWKMAQKSASPVGADKDFFFPSKDLSQIFFKFVKRILFFQLTYLMTANIFQVGSYVRTAFLVMVCFLWAIDDLIFCKKWRSKWHGCEYMKTRCMEESLKGFIKNLNFNVFSLELTYWILPYLWITAHVLTKLFFTF